MMINSVGVIVVLICVALAILGLIVGVRLIWMVLFGGSAPPAQPAYVQTGQNPSATRRRKCCSSGSAGFFVMLLAVVLIFGMLFAVRAQRSADIHAEVAQAQAQEAAARAQQTAIERATSGRPTAEAINHQKPPVKSVSSPDGAASPVNDKSELMAQISSVITKIKNSPVPLPSVELLKQLEQFQSALYKQQATDIVPTSTNPPPAWVKDSVMDANLHVVMSKPHVTEAKATEEAMALATQLVLDDYRKHMAGVGNLSLNLDSLPTAAVRKRYTEELSWDLFAETDLAAVGGNSDASVYRTYLQVRTSPELRSAIYAHWKRHVQDRRFEAIALLFVGAVAMVTLLAGSYRIDNRTGGRWRWPLRLASLVAVGAIGVVILEDTGPELSRALENHIGPATEHIHPPSESETVQSAVAATPVQGARTNSHFATLPIHGRRVAFVVLGDHRFRESGKLEMVNDEIVDCLKEFGSVDFKIVCQSSTGRKLASGSLRNGRVRGGGLRNIERALQGCFTSNAKSVYPEDSVRLVRSFRPDSIIVVRDADADIDADRRITNDMLGQVFSKAGTVVHAVELGGHADKRVSMVDLASRTGGQYVLWQESR